MSQSIRNLVLVGIDEAGRGPLAGPVTAGALVLSAERRPKGLRDSKQLSEARRNELYAEICDSAVAYSVVSLGPEEIDRINIRQATRKAMAQAADEVLKQIPGTEGYLMIDGNMDIPSEHSQEFVIKGDQKLTVISGASILAKVTRDRLMEEYDRLYPGYGFASHKGYGTKLHREAIASLGPLAIHRKSFAGVKEHL